MTTNPVEIIRKKRDGGKLTKNEIQYFVNGYLNGKITDYQMSAFLMAVYFSKMDFDETVTFTEIMLNSGVVVDLSSVPGIKVDKHSTGGVGDKVSLILAPMVASCGVPVPMISGRGLGHTGGTLDKLESIPGFRTNLSLNEYRRVIEEIGVVMIGQTDDIAPADKKMYALRDVTATVESIPLIAGSIMSKKLAEGIDALVLDIKTGCGAFMTSIDQAIELGNTLVAIGSRFGKKVVGFLTDMNQPLGYAVGNWLEVVECINCMKGQNVGDLMKVTYLLGGAMVWLGGKSNSIEDGIQLCRQKISSGDALNKFIQMVEKQGGDTSVIENPSLYPSSKYQIEVKSDSVGYVESIDALEIGFISIMLGAGRMKVDDAIDPKAGILLNKKVGDYVKEGELLATIFSDQDSNLQSAVKRLKSAIKVSKTEVISPLLIHGYFDENGYFPKSTYKNL